MSKTPYLGRHRVVQVSVTARVARTGATAAAATTAVAVASVGLLASPAGAAPTHNWDGVAQCESGGNWHINTGNSFYGGLQFTRSTWLGYGGGVYASRADLASEGEQIAIAERVLRGQGIGAWPVCGQYLGAAATVTPPAHRTHPAPQPAPVDRDGDRDDSRTQPRAGGNRYTVRSGDTLNRIATAHHITGGWQTLAHLNRTIIDNPNLIYPGQRITLCRAARGPPPLPTGRRRAATTGRTPAAATVSDGPFDVVRAVQPAPGVVAPRAGKESGGAPADEGCCSAHPPPGTPGPG